MKNTVLRGLGRKISKLNPEGYDNNNERIDNKKAFALLINASSEEAYHTMMSIVK